MKGGKKSQDEAQTPGSSYEIKLNERREQVQHFTRRAEVNLRDSHDADWLFCFVVSVWDFGLCVHT